ncbi:MAG TPA: MmgE/PrpD family protein [Candidatus Acidoferrales bacterium]|nr:MmgE/PrpD family protein [Candidatus Acidoferrales bacterium]
MSKGISERIAEWVVQAQYEDLPRRVVEEAKNQILSVVAAVHAGHFSDSGRTVSKTVKEWGGAKEATMIPSGERVSLHNAIYANTALSMALDYDDYLFAGHTGHSAVLVTLALAEHAGVSGKDFLLAQVLANEVGGRVGASAMAGPLNGQMWSFIHLVNGALITGKLLGLDAAQIQSALGIALAQPNFPLRAAFFASDAKVLLASTTAAAGVQAAQLAANGLRGHSSILDGEDGFSQVFATQSLPGAFEGFGKTWLTDTLSYKLYPGCAYIDTTIDCVLSLQRQHSIDAKKVKAVHVAAGPLTLGMEALSAQYVRDAETLPVTLNFAVGYNVAAALIDKELTARQFMRERIKDPATWDLAKRVSVTLDEVAGQRMRERSLVKTVTDEQGEHLELNLANAEMGTFRMSFGSRVRIELEDGRSFEAEQEVPFGAMGRPFDDRRKSVEDKFRRETRYTLRKEKMEKAIDMVLHLEQANSAQLREVVRLCCSERS